MKAHILGIDTEALLCYVVLSLSLLVCGREGIKPYSDSRRAIHDFLPFSLTVRSDAVHSMPSIKLGTAIQRCSRGFHSHGSIPCSSGVHVHLQHVLTNEILTMTLSKERPIVPSTGRSTLLKNGSEG